MLLKQEGLGCPGGEASKGCPTTGRIRTQPNRKTNLSQRCPPTTASFYPPTVPLQLTQIPALSDMAVTRSQSSGSTSSSSPYATPPRNRGAQDPSATTSSTPVTPATELVPSTPTPAPLGTEHGQAVLQAGTLPPPSSSGQADTSGSAITIHLPNQPSSPTPARRVWPPLRDHMPIGPVDRKDLAGLAILRKLLRLKQLHGQHGSFCPRDDGRTTEVHNLVDSALPLLETFTIVSPSCRVASQRAHTWR